MVAATTWKALAAGVVIGFIVLVIVNYRPGARKSAHEKGEKPPLQALLFFSGGQCYHIHHFMYMLPFAAALWVHKLGETVAGGLTGLLIGGSLEDLLYGKDILKIKGHCENKRAIDILKQSDDGSDEF